MASTETRLLTPGRMAELLNVPVHRVLYILQTRPHIQSVGRAGALRVYNRDALAQVRHELNTIDAKRAEREGVTA